MCPVRWGHSSNFYFHHFQYNSGAKPGSGNVDGYTFSARAGCCGIHVAATTCAKGKESSAISYTLLFLMTNTSVL